MAAVEQAAHVMFAPRFKSDELAPKEPAVGAVTMYCPDSQVALAVYQTASVVELGETSKNCVPFGAVHGEHVAPFL
jgi:hypothetical protein